MPIEPKGVPTICAKGDTAQNQSGRVMRQVNARCQENPPSESGIPADHCWPRGSPPHISDGWSELISWRELCRFPNGAIAWRCGCQRLWLTRSISKKATRSRFESQMTGSSKWAAIKVNIARSLAYANSNVLCLPDLSLTGKTPMPVKAFFDTNVLIYAVALDDPRSTQAENLLASGGVLSVQVLNEFVSVARRKIFMSWSDVTEALDAFGVLCPSPLPITAEMHEAARKIAENHDYNISDALVVAAALEAGCATLYSEDFRDGQTIDGQLTIRNPFARSSG